MKHHLLIAGTGRAGTSFLVKFLHACGVETHLSKHNEGTWDENANAGLEDFPGRDADLPYVIKTPWLFESATTLLERDDIAIDAAIIPVRDLAEAAASRVIVELRARYASGNLPDDENTWETWGMTAGGILYSVNPLDQARILAVGFHEVIRAFVHRDIPVVLLDFPRFVENAEYAFEQLKSFIPIEREAAIAAHQSVADLSKVRIAAEIRAQADRASERKPELIEPDLQFPSINTVDSIALRRELRRMHQALADASATNARIQSEQATADRRAEDCRARLASTEAALANAQLAVAKESEEQTVAEKRIQDFSTQLLFMEAELVRARQEAADERSRTEDLRRKSAMNETEKKAAVHKLQIEIDAYRTSTSWRVTAPMRALRSLFLRH